MDTHIVLTDSVPLLWSTEARLLTSSFSKQSHRLLYWDHPAVAQPHEVELAVLLCRIGNTGSQLVGLILHSWGDGYYSRTKELVLVDTFVSHVRFKSWTQTQHVIPQHPFQLRNGDILFRRWTSPSGVLG